MKEIDIDELKHLQLEMLKKIDSFCNENKIKYFLTAGTLIGAVRHGGYIPWDDDIDIMMLRSDYDKFLQLFNGKIENLVVDAPELNWNYYAPYANVYDNRTLLEEGAYNGHRGQEIGVKIDVFPFDILPDSELLYTITRRLVRFLNKIMAAKRNVQPFYKMRIKTIFVRLFFCWLPFSTIQKIIRFIATSNTKNTDGDIFLRTFDITEPMRARKEVFASTKMLKFEDYSFPVPVEYDEYLKIRFGDYMKLPPVEKRVAEHNFKAYWK